MSRDGRGGVMVRASSICVPAGLVDLAVVEGQLAGYDSRRSGPYREFSERHFGTRTLHELAPSEGTVELIAKAGAEVLAKVGARSTDLEAVIVATLTPDDWIAGARGDLLDRLGLSGVAAFELRGGCSALVNCLALAVPIVAGTGGYVLIAAGERVRGAIMDACDITQAGLFGDAAAALLLGPGDRGRGVENIRTWTRSEWWSTASTGPTGKFRMAGRILKERAPALFCEVLSNQLVYLESVSPETVATRGRIIVAPHQVNGVLLREVAAGLELDPSVRIPARSWVNVVECYGNTASASMFISLHHAIERTAATPGSVIIGVGFGAGFDCGSFIYRV